jgi:hypothetical protein
MARSTALSVGDLESLIPSFERSLRAANKSPKTVKGFGEATRLLVTFLAANGMPTDTSVGGEHVEMFTEAQLAEWKPATANNRYRALAQFFKFLVDFDEMHESPMAKMSPPKVPGVPVRSSPTTTSARYSRWSAAATTRNAATTPSSDFSRIRGCGARSWRTFDSRTSTSRWAWRS